MSRLDETAENFAGGNVTLHMVLGVMSYCERMSGALVERPRRRRPVDTPSVERTHPVDLVVLGLESFAASLAGLCGPMDRRRTGRGVRSELPALDSIRQVLR